ncbi:MAG: transposase family protein [Pleurocapsa sp. MO_226.B13]|nr:transposase family protein [Pleurocapsa sp. MO_226.B13]
MKRAINFPQEVSCGRIRVFFCYEPKNVTTFQPKNKPRGGELTAAEKERNREISSQRILVEHHIGSVKRSNIVHQTFRNRKDDYVDLVMETASGLHNFRVSQRLVAVA